MPELDPAPRPGLRLEALDAVCGVSALTIVLYHYVSGITAPKIATPPAFQSDVSFGGHFLLVFGDAVQSQGRTARI
jgi:hypothetical protein